MQSVKLGLELSHTLVDLKPTSWYRCCIVAANSCGEGPMGDWSVPIRLA
jgi:hypothetical protein